MCLRRPHVRQCYERGNAPYQDSLGSCEMAGNGRLRRHAARCLQEVPPDEWAKAFPRQAISLHLAKVLDLPPTFCERIIDYGLSRYPERFTIQNCQLSGRKEDTGKMTYDLIQKYRDRAHHGFQSLAALARPNERMGSIEMAALNVVHAGGEYWELWHGDGLSVETSGAVLRIWEEAKSRIRGLQEEIDL